MIHITHGLGYRGGRCVVRLRKHGSRKGVVQTQLFIFLQPAQFNFGILRTFTAHPLVSQGFADIIQNLTVWQKRHNELLR